MLLEPSSDCWCPDKYSPRLHLFIHISEYLSILLIASLCLILQSYRMMNSLVCYTQNRLHVLWSTLHSDIDLYCNGIYNKCEYMWGSGLFVWCQFDHDILLLIVSVIGFHPGYCRLSDRRVSVWVRLDFGIRIIHGLLLPQRLLSLICPINKNRIHMSVSACVGDTCWWPSKF